VVCIEVDGIAVEHSERRKIVKPENIRSRVHNKVVQTSFSPPGTFLVDLSPHQTVAMLPHPSRARQLRRRQPAMSGHIPRHRILGLRVDAGREPEIRRGEFESVELFGGPIRDEEGVQNVSMHGERVDDVGLEGKLDVRAVEGADLAAEADGDVGCIEGGQQRE